AHWRLSDPVGHLQHFIAGILDQTDLRLELAHYELFRKHFAGHAGVRFPATHAALSSRRVLTMEFMRGVKVDALPAGDHADIAIFDAGLVKQLDENVLLQFMDFTKCLSMGTPHDFVNHLQKFHTYIGEV